MSCGRRPHRRDRRRCAAQRAVLCAWLCLAAWGCAAPGSTSLSPEAPTTRRSERRQELVEQMEADRSEAEFQAALNAWQRDDAKGCEEALRRILARHPDARDARLLLVDVCLSGNRPEEAYQQMQTVLEQSPDDPPTLFAMGMLLDDIGRHADALAYYHRAVDADPQNELYVAALRLANETGQPIVPADAVAEAAGRGEVPPAVRDLANPASAVGDVALTSAVAPLQSSRGGPLPPPAPDDGLASPPAIGTADPLRTTSALTSPPRPGVIPTPFPRSGRSDGNPKAGEARPSSRPGAGTPPVSAAADAVTAALRQGDEAVAHGDSTAALAAYREAIARSDAKSHTAIAAATTALRNNRPEIAVQLLQPLQTEYSDSAALFRTLGLAFYRLGDYAASQAALDRSLNLDKSNALAYFLMGCTLAKQGQRELADAHLRQAQVLDPRYSLRR